MQEMCRQTAAEANVSERKLVCRVLDWASEGLRSRPCDARCAASRAASVLGGSGEFYLDPFARCMGSQLAFRPLAPGMVYLFASSVRWGCGFAPSTPVTIDRA